MIPCIFKILFILTVSSNPTSYPQNPCILDTGQFFKSAQDFPWRFDSTSPWNKDQSYLKFGTARHLTLLHGCQAAQRATPTPKPPAESIPKSYLTSYSTFLLGWSHLALPHSKHPLHWHLFPKKATGRLWRASPCEDPMDTAVSLGSAWFGIEATRTATPDFAELLCNIWHFWQWLLPPPPANGKEQDDRNS